MKCGKKKPIVEFYIDFEIISNIFDPLNNIPKIGSNSIVFMIGLVSVINRDLQDFPIIKYHNFTAENLTNEEEYKIFTNMHECIKKYM